MCKPREKPHFMPTYISENYCSNTNHNTPVSATTRNTHEARAKVPDVAHTKRAIIVLSQITLQRR